MTTERDYQLYIEHQDGRTHRHIHISRNVRDRTYSLIVTDIHCLAPLNGLQDNAKPSFSTLRPYGAPEVYLTIEGADTKAKAIIEESLQEGWVDVTPNA
jgi:hypothetical protein